jgi:pilus assembly protein Flp/PilA
MNTVLRLLKDEKAATVIEYGLIASLIAVAIVGVLVTLGPALRATFQTVQNNLGCSLFQLPGRVHKALPGSGAASSIMPRMGAARMTGPAFAQGPLDLPDDYSAALGA